MRLVADAPISSGLARLYVAVLPGFCTAAVAWQSLTDPSLLPYAAIGVLVTGRLARIAVVVGPDAVVVRNPFRSYRIPYATVWEVGVEREVHLGNDHHPFVSASYLTLSTETGEVPLLATRWLPGGELEALRGRLVASAKAAEAAEPHDEVDRRPPFERVRDVLGDAVGWHRHLDDDADELAEILRERPLTEQDLDDVLNDSGPGLVDRLNEAGRRRP